MKRILVCGGAGFIGSHLCERLLNEGNEVICLDSYFSGRKDSICHLLLLSNPYFEAIRHDVINPIQIECDEIYNLACPASPVHYQHNPIKTINTSVMGAINVLELAKRLNVKVLQASTSEIYGDPLEHPQKETYWGNVNPIGVRACYDESKRCAETLFINYHRQEGVKIKIVRISNTYGPKMLTNDGRVISNFIIQALKGEDITIYGNGKQTRSFQYISDLVEGLIKMMDSADDFTGPVNIGNPYEFTIDELADLIIHITDSKSKIIYKPLPADDPVRRQLDITLAKEKLGWVPHVDLLTGLKNTICYFKNILIL